MVGFIFRAVIAAVGLWLATLWVAGIHIDSPLTLVLAGALTNSARAQTPSASTGTYSVYGPYSTRPLTGTYSVYGPYTGRYSSSSSSIPTSSDSNTSSKTAAPSSQTGKGNGQGDDANRPDAGRGAAAVGGPGARRPRYVRLSIAGNAIQAIVIP